jgi:hypothetical protein
MTGRFLIAAILLSLVARMFIEVQAQTGTCVTGPDGGQICHGYAGSGAPAPMPGYAYGHPSYAPAYGAGGWNRSGSYDVNRDVQGPHGGSYDVNRSGSYSGGGWRR